MTALATPPAPSMSTPFAPEAHTSAPLRLVMEAPVEASVGETLAAVLRLEGVVDYLPSIRHADIEVDDNGLPTLRVCEVSGMGRLDEDIVWRDATLGYAYSVRPTKQLPMVDHLGVATVRPGRNGSVVRWEQYFNWRGTLKPLVMRLMFPRMMRTLGTGLQRDLGAAGRVEVAWR